MKLPTRQCKNTILETGKDLLVSGTRWRTDWLSHLETLTGCWAGNHRHRSLQHAKPTAYFIGIGMMAANGFQKSKAVNGLEGLDGVKTG